MKKFLAFFLPVLGAIYLSAYIRSAVLDVVYTDYMRIINTYLYHPFSPALYFRKDTLTRLPITYFACYDGYCNRHIYGKEEF